MRLVPVDLGTPQLAAGDATVTIPLSLRQRPRPCCRRSRESWRIARPTAMVSMSVIGPTISKYMWPHRSIGVGEREFGGTVEQR